MDGIAVKIDLSQLLKINKGLERLSHSFADWRSLGLAIAAQLQSSTRRRFESGGKKTPAGIPCTSSLKRTGELQNSIEGFANEKIVRVGSNLPYARIHQFGGVIKPKNKQALAFSIGGKEIFAKSVTIKANPYLGISKEDEENIMEIIENAIEKEFDRA